MSTHPIIEALDRSYDEAVQRLCDLLKIPSVSTDPAYAAHVAEAAQWVADHLKASGLTADVCRTDGHPVVLARTTDDDVEDPDAPRVLFYGHYDVQPPDPLEKWTTGPFEPTVRDGAIYARGASDDKGQVACFLEALRAYHDAGRKLPCHVTVMIEGEEECGSVGLPGFLEKYQEQLAADIVVVSDTTMWNADTPAITYAMRGLIYFDLKLHGPGRDLHSGVYGGTLANPATILPRVLARLLDDDNHVTIPGFYDDVAPLESEEAERWAKLGFKDEDFLGAVGAEPFGEAGYATLERRWARPSCDVNGLYGGYMGEGAKTVIPSFAGAKVSFRIPANMDPVKTAELFTNWLQSQDTGGCRWQITQHGKAYPVAVAIDSPYIAAAGRAIEQAKGRPPVLVRDGATIPIIADFKQRLGLDTLLIGFGLNDDNIHSPNERFGLDRFKLGCHTHALLLEQMADIKAVKRVC
jgi:acetylornithine deacetylase/succinyl-diaminopimelate desuccinylase-like protein